MSSQPDRPAPAAARWGKAFGRFWWDFLVGDTPELFLGALAVLGVVALLVHAWGARSVAVVALPALVGVLFAMTLVRAWRQKRPR